MWKQLLVFLLGMFGAFCSPAQVKDTALGAVRYVFVYVPDRKFPADTTTEPMILYIGKKMSVYRSENRVLYDSAFLENVKSAELEFKAGGVIRFSPISIKKGSSQACIKDFENAKLTDVQTLIRDYSIEEEMPEINWRIEAESRTITGLLCQKAITDFRGRHYTAWFCSQIPFNNGPWKLGGLPGLIIEAEDDTKEVVFRFAGYEDLSGKHKTVDMPARLTKATTKEFKRLQDLAESDPHALMNASASGQNIRFTNYPPNSIIQKPGKNPIERTSN